MRLYMILRDRSATVPESKLYAWMPLTGPEGLDLQMGVKPYEQQRRWRQLVGKWLDEIRRYWPACPTEIHEAQLDGHHRLKVERSLPAGRA